MRVLLVDDSAAHRKVGVQQLRELGHEVETTSSYWQALRLASAQPSLEVALLDLMMPAEAEVLGSEALTTHLGTPFPAGYGLALNLLASPRMKHIAIATDTNHHNHPASAFIDTFPRGGIVVGDRKILVMHAPMTGDGTKDWGEVLKRLTE